MKAKPKFDLRPAEFILMDDLNALPRTGGKRPFGPVVFMKDEHRNEWWALDPKKLWAGFGFCYPSLRAAVSDFLVTITEYDASSNAWTGVPI